MLATITKGIVMIYTPLDSLTLPEFILHLCNKEDPSDEDIESLHHIELLQFEIEDLQNRVAELEAMEYADGDA